MASGNANVIAFPDLPPKGSRGPGGKRALLGPELGTQFLTTSRLRSATVCLLFRVKAMSLITESGRLVT